MFVKPVNPFALNRRTVWRDNKPVAIPISQGAASALNDWHQRHHDEIAEVLAPYGLHPYDVLAPEWQRCVYEDEGLVSGDGTGPTDVPDKSEWPAAKR
jgi:hypothetical protein